MWLTLKKFEKIENLATGKGGVALLHREFEEEQSVASGGVALVQSDWGERETPYATR